MLHCWADEFETLVGDTNWTTPYWCPAMPEEV